MTQSDVSDIPATHIIIPDTQVKPGVDTTHLGWIGQWIVDNFRGKENVTIIHLGDHWDFPSLSHWDKGTFQMEGRRVKADIDAGNDGLALLTAAIDAANAKAGQQHMTKWRPRMVLLRGNHEDRLTRLLNAEPTYRGLLDMNMLLSPGWEVYPFLKPVTIDGVSYAHYWSNPMTGKPLGGQAATRLKTVGMSATMGHQQVLDYAIRFVGGQSQHMLIAGACYLHDEDYKSYQGNAHWRGIVCAYQVENGSYDPLFLSLDYLCRRYEGIRLTEYMQRTQ